jgi:hypothetical protein
MMPEATIVVVLLTSGHDEKKDRKEKNREEARCRLGLRACGD